MHLFDDIKSPILLYLKGGLFALLAGMAAVLIVIADNRWYKIGLLIVCVWASCRFYYFLFYVLDHYVGGDKNASVFAMILKLCEKKSEMTQAIKLSMYVAISLDGFIARPDGNIDWLTEHGSQDDLENDDGYKEFLASVDALVMGGKTYRQVLTFGDWPYHGKKCVVVSRTETKTDLPDVFFKTHSPEKIVQRLQNAGCRHIWVMGGGEIHSLFLQAGLIDEMRIFVIPKILGEGIPLFAPPVPDVRWKLLSQTEWQANIVELRYRRQD